MYKYKRSPLQLSYRLWVTTLGKNDAGQGLHVLTIIPLLPLTWLNRLSSEDATSQKNLDPSLVARQRGCVVWQKTSSYWFSTWGTVALPGATIPSFATREKIMEPPKKKYRGRIVKVSHVSRKLRLAEGQKDKRKPASPGPGDSWLGELNRQGPPLTGLPAGRRRENRDRAKLKR